MVGQRAEHTGLLIGYLDVEEDRVAVDAWYGCDGEGEEGAALRFPGGEVSDGGLGAGRSGQVETKAGVGDGLDADAVSLIEALPAVQYDVEHIPGAGNLPGDLDADTARRLAPHRSRTVVTYCTGRSCNRSTVAAAAFVRLGYTDVRVYTGGKIDWADAGLPFESTRSIEAAA